MSWKGNVSVNFIKIPKHIQNSISSHERHSFIPFPFLRPPFSPSYFSYALTGPENGILIFFWGYLFHVAGWFLLPADHFALGFRLFYNNKTLQSNLLILCLYHHKAIRIKSTDSSLKGQELRLILFLVLLGQK